MSFRNLAIAAIALASLSACSGNNDKQTFAPSAQEEGTGSGDASSYQAGTPLYTFSVEEGQIMIDNANVDSIDDAALEGYPTLASHTKAIGSITKAVETNGNALELYAGDEMLMAFDTRGDSESLLWSRDGFNAQNVVFNRSEASEQDQTPASGDVTFTLNECKVAEEKVEEKQQEQEQGKVEEKQQEQGKVEEKQAQEQAKLASFLGAEEQGQGKQEQEQAQGKEQEQGKVEEKGAPAPECKTVSIRLNLRQIVEEKKQEQEQGKVEEKQQEQGKVEEKQQDQGKVEEKQQEQGKQEQEQGKVEEKQQEQGKVEEKQQDQGKVEEKQQEQGKQEQEQAQGQEKR